MPPTHDTSILARTHVLEDGERVRLRLGRRSDAPAVAELLRARGVEASEIDVRRTLGYDPAARRVFLALATIDARDALVGIGAIDLHTGADVDTLVVDEQAAPGLSILFGAFLERCAASRRRAA